MTIFRNGLFLLLISSVSLVAQTSPANQYPVPEPKAEPKTDSKAPVPVVRDRAAAYYHYSLAHIYEELVSLYGRTEFANRAIDEYKLAIANDPDSSFLNSGLAELYAKTSRIRDAVIEAQNILKRDPNNLDARKLLGRIYLRSLGDMQSGTQSQEVLKLAIEQFDQIVRLEPKAVENHLLLGRLYILNKEMQKAEAAFKTAVHLQPDSEEAVTSLAFLYNEQGNTAKAAQILSEVPESGRTAKLYAALGLTYEQQRQHKKAIEAFRKAVELDKENLDALRGLAQNLMSDGQLELALERYKQVIEEDPQDAQAQLRIAEIQRRTGKLDAALESLKKAETLVQDSLEVPYNYALIYSAQGRYEEAIQTLQGLIEKTTKADNTYNTSEANNRALFLERLGGLYRESGKTQLAIETFRKTLNLGDDNAVRGYQQLIDTYREAKQWSHATQVAQEASSRFPRDRGLKMVLAGQLADVGQAARGVELAKSQLSGGKDDRDVYLALSQIHSRLRQWQEAEATALKAEQLSESADEREYVQFVQGSIFERQKKWEAAEERFRKVLTHNASNAQALNYLGYMLADRNVRLEEALTLIRKALELEPQNGAYLDSIGWAYYRLGKYELAEENLRKAVAKSNNDATVHDHLGDVYFKTGRLKLAAAHWERALEEWNKSVPAEVETAEVAKVQKKLENARVKLAKQEKQ
ncbi:MAG TPA: tetratricopeptide repeat protein [Terriglobales bacterium]|nr:tetratricopeptide repeat protein [Terriglobales bacterium]